MSSRQKTYESISLAETLGEHLAGIEPAIQGAAIAQIVATFLAGHHPLIREKINNQLTKTINNLIPLIEAQAENPHEDATEH